MIEFNFFEDTKETLLEKFCEYFNLEVNEIAEYFEDSNPDDLSYTKVIKDLKIVLDNHDSSEIGIVCRHMTTTTEDGIGNFYEMGLLDLKSMLQLHTPLSEHLKKFGVEVNVDKKVITISEKKYPILSSSEICEQCIKGEKDTVCTGYHRCELREKLGFLAVKLYQYEATIEFFINATVEEMERYSTLNRYPEILETLAQVLSKVDERRRLCYEMCYAWKNLNKVVIIVEFTSKVSEMETFAPYDYDEAYRECGECLENNGFSYMDYIGQKIPWKVFDNMCFVKWFLSIYFYNDEKYGSLLSGGMVLGDRIKIYKVIDGQLVMF